MELKIELYKILWDQLNGEMNRFWIRYNVLLGIQIAVVITLLKPLIEQNNKYVSLAYIFLLIISYVTFAIGKRAIETFNFTLLAIKKFEKLEGNAKLNLFSSLSKSLSGEEAYIDLRSPKAYELSLIIPLIGMAAWSILIIYEIDFFISTM